MGSDYSAGFVKELQARFQKIGLYRPMRPQRYEVGDELVLDVTGLSEPTPARVRLVIDKFVGGGFAGQVYRVKLVDFVSGSVPGLEVGGSYAIKILIPPSGFAQVFRNALYFVGFQGAFQLQTNPAAARSGALWQRFIRRAAKLRFGDEQAVVNIHATFVDAKLGSCGEVSEWIEGRTWRLEVDARLDLLRRWCRGRKTDPALLGSPEYRAKREFMRSFVQLLHEVGAHEFARQYEWSTCKSQPNCLKRASSEPDPEKGLVAVDFRAGLALLPFLPMSPGDFKLILSGLGRGSLVQFDRGDLKQLQNFITDHPADFADMGSMFEELKACEETYRNSLPDLTHNHVRLLYSRKLWSTLLKSSVTGWKIRGLADESTAKRFETRKLKTLGFAALGVIPFLGRVLRRLWARPDWRKHYGAMATSPAYLWRALKGRAVEKAMDWYRTGRVDEARARRIAESPSRYLGHLPLSILPAGLHRFFSDPAYAKSRLSALLVRPFRLYFNAPLREQWLLDMVVEGRRKHILGEEDAKTIQSQLKEPYIQQYLKSLVVHMCLMPTTHIVNAIVVIYFLSTHRGMSAAQASAYAALITAAFQITPISPGSLARGLYVVYLMARDRNFKDYNVAVFLSFFKYIGYLAFPIQMTYRYPTLARFMAGHWATEAVHAVPVFGEGGALLERKVFDFFYNWPLTLRRRMNARAELRATMKPRYLHALGWTLLLGALFFALDAFYLHKHGMLPTLRKVWWATVSLPFVAGVAITLGAAGAALKRRIAAAALCGASVGLLYPVLSRALSHSGSDPIGVDSLWRLFLYTLFATLGALTMEMLMPEPEVPKPQ